MKKFNKALCVVLSLILALSMFVACGSSEESATVQEAETSEETPTVVEETVLNTTCTTTPEYLDTARGSGENDHMIFVNTYETLVVPSEVDGSAEAFLATEWSNSEDSLTWTFKLREDVTFSDGSPLTASDVKYSMDRLIAIGEGHSNIFSGVVSEVNVIDDYTVDFVLTKAFGPFVNALTVLYIINEDVALENTLSEGSYGENGDYATGYLLDNAAGSGPYVVEDFLVHESITLAKNENYWGEISEDAPDKVHTIELIEAASTKMLLTNGEVDMVHGRQENTTLVALTENENIEYADTYEMGLNYFMINTKVAPTDDINIRKAISYATDRTTMSAVYGDAPVTEGLVPFSLWGYSDNITKYDYDLDAAKEAIAESAYADTLADYPITIHSIEGNGDTNKLVMLLAESLQSLGFAVQIEEVPWVLFSNNAASIETSPNITNLFASAAYPEAGSLLELKYASYTQGGWNQNEWLGDENFDAMITEALEISDPDARLAKYEEIQQYLTEEVVPSVSPFMSVVKPIFNTDSFSSPMTEGNIHPSLQHNFYYADYSMK